MKIQHLIAKVKPRRTILTLLAVGSLLTAGCGKESSGGEATEETPVADRERFGDPYEIVTTFYEGEPDVMPQIAGDTLTARITYTGGCDDHDFDLRHEVDGDTAQVWLRHDGSGDDCEERVRDELRLPVPEEVVAAPVIVLLNPHGGDPFMVKWGR